MYRARSSRRSSRRYDDCEDTAAAEEEFDRQPIGRVFDRYLARYGIDVAPSDERDQLLERFRHCVYRAAALCAAHDCASNYDVTIARNERSVADVEFPERPAAAAAGLDVSSGAPFVYPDVSVVALYDSGRVADEYLQYDMASSVLASTRQAAILDWRVVRFHFLCVFARALLVREGCPEYTAALDYNTVNPSVSANYDINGNQRRATLSWDRPEIGRLQTVSLALCDFIARANADNTSATTNVWLRYTSAVTLRRHLIAIHGESLSTTCPPFLIVIPGVSTLGELTILVDLLAPFRHELRTVVINPPRPRSEWGRVNYSRICQLGDAVAATRSGGWWIPNGVCTGPIVDDAALRHRYTGVFQVSTTRVGDGDSALFVVFTDPRKAEPVWSLLNTYYNVGDTLTDFLVRPLYHPRATV